MYDIPKNFEVNENTVQLLVKYNINSGTPDNF